MKIKPFLIVALLALAVSSYGQQRSPWDKLSWLNGDWQGSGSGEPGSGGGTFTFKPDLSQKILVRRSHVEYPKTADKPAVIHDDLLIVYLDDAGQASKAIYFDNEGHTINYGITAADTSIVFLSEKVPNTPVFRLTYTLLDPNTMSVKFEMAADGQNFKTFVEGKCHRTK